MPIYAYHCKACKINFDIFDSREVLDNENFKAQCPKCESFSCEKTVSKTDFVLKGNGWAKDNYGLGRKSRDTAKIQEKRKP